MRIGRVCDALLDALMSFAQLPPEPGVPEITDARRNAAEVEWQLAPFPAVPVLVASQARPNP